MSVATSSSIQDRTPEFRSILAHAQKRLAHTKTPANRQQQHLLPNAAVSSQQAASQQPTRKQRSEFARKAAEVGRGIAATVGKLERLGQLARRKTLFDDKPVEIAELTYVIKQDLAALSQQIGALSLTNKTAHPKAANSAADQEGQHNENVVAMLKTSLENVGGNFKEVLEVRTKNMVDSRSRQNNFVSTVGGNAGHLVAPGRSDSPLYAAPSSRGRSPQPPHLQQGQDLLTLEPPSSSSSALTRGMQSEQQMLLLEEGNQSNGYIQQRGEAIEGIERTIAELGGIFGQLAQMVSEQGDMVQRIDANTEDIIDNVEGAQRELMKYWNRVQGNRWLVAKMFGVLMICEYTVDPSHLFFFSFAKRMAFC
jgi:syntaxin 5